MSPSVTKVASEKWLQPNPNKELTKITEMNEEYYDLSTIKSQKTRTFGKIATVKVNLLGSQSSQSDR